MAIEKEKLGILIEKIKSGDSEAFEELYRLTSPKAYFVALQILKNEHDAEDILQETYIKVLEKINEIDPSKSFMGWLYRVISNKSKNLLKKRNIMIFEEDEDISFEEIPEDNAEFIPEENINQAETCREVMAAIDELTAEKRVCIVMKYFGEMTVSEIAESLEVPESTVKNRLFVARKELKARFEKNGSAALYSAAPIGIVIWALAQTSESISAAFAVSTVSAGILTGIGATSAAVTTAASATAATASGAATAAATGTGIAAKAAALSVAQKVVVGIAATAVVGGSAAGVVTVVKNNNRTETTAYIEESTTAPTQKAEEVINRITAPAETSAAETSTESATEFSFNITLPSRKPYTTKPKTTAPLTTAKQTTLPSTSATVPETTTETATAVPETTVVTTTHPQTTQPTTLAQATLIIEVTDFDDNVVDTLNLNIEAGTEMTWDYLITLVSQNGYEAMAGIYGDGVGTVAQAGETYTFTAEL